MRKAPAVLSIGLACSIVVSFTAQAAWDYHVERGDWAIWTTGQECLLLPKGIQLTPFNSIQISGDKSGSFVLHAAFWPGAFETSSHHTLEIEYSETKVLEIAAEAISNSVLKTNEPMKISDLYQLAIAKQIFIRTSKIQDQDTLLFSMTDFDAAFSALQHCMTMLKQVD